MCGIVAMLSSEKPIASEALTRATAALHHRGPDGKGQWIAPHGRVGLGHARLSIIDLTTGDQPIANEDESLHVVVNGEFYDYQRHQRALADRGHRLRTRSDSEIALHLYEEEGVHCLRHLRGEFAFVLWDEPNGLLFAARDRFGIKPLYYARWGDTLYFASEAKALFAAGVPARWDHESVYRQLHGIMDGDRSLFAGVYQVPPGHYLLASRHHTQILRYWDLNYPTLDTPPPVRTEAEHVERMREELREAIRLRLRADVPVGCYVSGGLDSCAILGMAADLRDDPVEAFTIAFEEGPFDEGPIAEEMARHVGARFHGFRMPEAMLAQHYPDAVAHCEMVALNANCVAKYLLSREVRDFGFKVVITGEGSDEILAGYPSSAATCSSTTPARTPGPPRSASPPCARRTSSTAGSGGRRSNPPARGRRPDARLRALDRGELRRAGSPHAAAAGRRVPGGVRGARPVPRAPEPARRDGPDAGAPEGASGDVPVGEDDVSRTSCSIGDRMEMAHSIEGRTPFLDHHLVEAVVAMPVDMKVHATTEKYVLREAARPYLTQTVYRRQKHPFVAPIELRGGLYELVQDTLRGRVLSAAPFFDPAAVAKLLDGLPGVEDQATRDRVFPLLLIMTSTCILHERYRL